MLATPSSQPSGLDRARGNSGLTAVDELLVAYHPSLRAADVARAANLSDPRYVRNAQGVVAQSRLEAQLRLMEHLVDHCQRAPPLCCVEVLKWDESNVRVSLPLSAETELGEVSRGADASAWHVLLSRRVLLLSWAGKPPHGAGFGVAADPRNGHKRWFVVEWFVRSPIDEPLVQTHRRFVQVVRYGWSGWAKFGK